jgi:signal transduction histidine kinase
VEAIESKMQTQIVNVNFSDALKSMAQLSDIPAKEKQISIIQSVDGGIIVLADPSNLNQVIENLLSNAIKFSPPGKSIYINLRKNEREAICEIKDEGPGLTDSDKTLLFKKYQRLSATPTGNESSTGLGLSIVKKFVEAMNGEIWCESEAGKGASFFVKLRLANN